jgi:hypothetical protein
MIRICYLLSVLIVCFLCCANTIAREDAPDTLVICPTDFQSALQPWIKYRTEQGHKIQVVTPQASSAGIHKQIVAAAGGAKSTSLKHVVIVGDVSDGKTIDGRRVATDSIVAKVNVRFGSDPTIPTDNTFADLDKDGLPDVAIGRIPVDTVEELTQFTNRVIAYEATANNEAWRNRVNCIAGVGGFGPMIDGVIEQTTKQFLMDLIPPAYETSMTYGSWTSPYCPDPRNFSREAINRFNEGCMFWVYIGHGARHYLDRIHMPDRSYDILTNRSVTQLDCKSGNPIAIFLACYTGDCSHSTDCLAENMLRRPNGPIAIVSGTRVTMPYGMGLFSLEMVHEFFEGDVETLGELVCVAKRRLVSGSDNHPEYRQMIQGMGETFSPVAKLLKQERLEHVDLMHLLGDPLLRLKRPAMVEVETDASVVAGGKLKIDCKIPFDGELRLELAYKRDRLRKRMARRKTFDGSDASLKKFQETYDQAIDLVWVEKSIDTKQGSVTVELDVPAGMTGKCLVRAILVSKEGFGLGSNPIVVKRK